MTLTAVVVAAVIAAVTLTVAALRDGDRSSPAGTGASETAPACLRPTRLSLPDGRSATLCASESWRSSGLEYANSVDLRRTSPTGIALLSFAQNSDAAASTAFVEGLASKPGAQRTQVSGHPAVRLTISQPAAVLGPGAGHGGPTPTQGATVRVYSLHIAAGTTVVSLEITVPEPVDPETDREVQEMQSHVRIG